MERKRSIQCGNYQGVIERYISLRDNRIDEERAHGWDPLVYKEYYDGIAHKHPQVLTAYMDIIESGTDEFGTYVLDIAEFAPQHALSLQTLIKEDFNWRRIYAQSVKHFRDISTEMIHTGEIVSGTRLSATDDEEKVRGFLRRNQKYVRKLCQRLQKEGVTPTYAQSDPEFFVERRGRLYQSDVINAWFSLVYNKKDFLNSIVGIYLDVPFPDQKDKDDCGRMIYDMRMFPDGRLKSGEKTFIRGGDIEGYMFFKPTERMLHWQREHVMQVLFDEEALIQNIIESRDLNDRKTQTKIRKILGQVEIEMKDLFT